MNVFHLIPIFLPLIRGIIQATRKDSAGGKKVTKGELEDLFFQHTPDIIEGIDQKVNS
jgi:hypothetical protein